MVMKASVKELTVKQYEWYKRKGMTDEKIMSLYGLNNASFYTWKDENNLKGVKFERDLADGGVKTTPLLREKHVTVSPFAKTEDANTIKNADSHKSSINYYPSESVSVSTSEPIQIPSPSTGDLKTPSNDENETSEIMSETIKESQDEIEAVNDELKDEKEESASWKRQYYEQIERGDVFRNKFLDMQRQNEKLKEQIGIETANRQSADKRADASLIEAYRDEQLTVEVMRKVVQMAERAKGEC